MASGEHEELKQRTAAAWRAFAAHVEHCGRCQRVETPAATHRKLCWTGGYLKSEALGARRALKGSER